jgi:hypothetical protein
LERAIGKGEEEELEHGRIHVPIVGVDMGLDDCYDLSFKL